MGGDETEAKAGVPGHLGRSVRPARSDAAKGWTPGYAAMSPFNAGSAEGRPPEAPPGPRGHGQGLPGSAQGRTAPSEGPGTPALASRLPRASKHRASRESSLRTDRRAQRSL